MAARYSFLPIYIQCKLQFAPVGFHEHVFPDCFS
jgi:hypothetical protein